jgi:HAD superfamily hydrolase (TIGR01549 family)
MVSEYDAVLFDHDGVLVDLTSVATHREGAREAFAAVGVDDPAPEDVDALSIGVTQELLADVCERYAVDPTVFWYHRDTVTAHGQYEEMRAGEKAPYDDLGMLADLEVPLGVVSSNQRTTVAFSLAYFDLKRHFETVEARDPTVTSLGRKKPAPYYVERALDALDATDALFVGDSESDLLAADRAGIDSVFVRRPHRADADLSTQPEYEIEGLDELPSLL